MANPDQESRDPHGHYVRTPEKAASDARAAELRAEGWTYQQIGDELGIDKTNARRACRRALREIVQGPAEKLLAMHMERLETLYEAALDVLEADHPLVSHGRVITDDTGQPLKDDGPKLAAIREARATMESFRRLVGLDAEQKINVSGGVRYEVVGITGEDLT